MKKVFLNKNLLEGNLPIYYKDGQNGGGIMWVDEMKDYTFPKMNKVMEMCSGPGFMGFYLHNKYRTEKLILVDIHKPLEESINKTNTENNLNAEFYLSDAFEQYDGDKVDFIVSNPPHITSEKDLQVFYDSNNNIDSDKKRILFDKDFQFHKKFLGKLDNYLTSGGYLFLLENSNSIPVSKILELNSKLVLKEIIHHKSFPNVYSALFQLLNS